METAPESENSTLNNELQAVVVRKEPERDLVTWNAPMRPFKKYGRKFYVTVFSIIGIISIILFIAEGVMPVVLLVSLIFLFYVLSTVQPEHIENKITNKGVKISGTFIDWQNVKSFCFAKKLGSDILLLDTLTFPGRIEIVINNNLKETLRKEISAYVSYKEAKPSSLDKVVGWIMKKLPESE